MERTLNQINNLIDAHPLLTLLYIGICTFNFILYMVAIGIAIASYQVAIVFFILCPIVVFVTTIPVAFIFVFLLIRNYRITYTFTQ